MTSEHNNRNISLLKKVFIGGFVGLAIVSITLLTSALQIMSIPLEWLDGFDIRVTEKSIFVDTPSSIFTASDIPFLLISLVGFTILIILVSYFNVLVEGLPIKKSLMIGTISLVISYFLWDPIVHFLMSIDGTLVISKLRFSPLFLFVLHLAVSMRILSQGSKFFYRFLTPLIGYCLSLVTALLIQKVLPSANNWRFPTRSLLQAPIAFMNITVFFDWSVRQHPIWNIREILRNNTERLAMITVLVVNGLTIILAMYISLQLSHLNS